MVDGVRSAPQPEQVLRARQPRRDTEPRAGDCFRQQDDLGRADAGPQRHLDGPRAQLRVHVRREPCARRLNEIRGTRLPVRQKSATISITLTYRACSCSVQRDAADHGVGVALRIEPPDDVAEDCRQHPRRRVA